jgi:hypothetical protein
MKKLLFVIIALTAFVADAYQLSKTDISNIVRLFDKQKKEWLNLKKKNTEPMYEKFFNQSINAIINDKEILAAIDAIAALEIDQSDEKQIERGIQMYAQCLQPIVASSKNEEEAQIRVMNLMLILEALAISVAQ